MATLRLCLLAEGHGYAQGRNPFLATLKPRLLAEGHGFSLTGPVRTGAREAPKRGARPDGRRPRKWVPGRTAV